MSSMTRKVQPVIDWPPTCLREVLQFLGLTLIQGCAN